MDLQFIKDVLRDKHKPPRWLFLTELYTKTGYSKIVGKDLDSERRLDCFAMCLWESGHFERIAYEIKTSRHDWLEELSDPIKKAHGFLLSNRFWFVLAEGIFVLKTDYRRVDGGCGIMEINELGQIKIIRDASRRMAFPMPDSFVASIARNAAKINEAIDG